MWKPHLLRLLVRTGLAARSGLVHRVKSASADLTDRYREKEAAGRRLLLTRFVSLGENCELGFVQEHLDAHPVDLFRWSGITADHLLTALETRFEGIGEAEHTAIRLNPNDLEFYIDDRRYGMVTHTRMSSRQHSEEHTLRVFQQRAKRLRVKLLDDLTDGERIFVFQSREPLSSEKLGRLHSAFASSHLGPS